jgi:uncharacterized membrane protein YkvA (DUF1232 family)
MMFNRLRRLSRVFGRDLVMLWYACRNPATPLGVRIATALIVLYVICPLDVIPDWLILFGWLDDVALLAFAIPAILNWVPGYPRYEARLAAERFLSRWKFWNAGH